MKRLDWVDIAKGIAIVLMILGHSSLPNMIQNWIYSFHMPFFFFISGVLMDNSIKRSKSISNTGGVNPSLGRNLDR